MTLHPRRHPLRAQTVAVGWLTIAWVLLWGDLSVANVLAGAALGLLVTRALPMPTIEFHGRVRPAGVARLVTVFAVERYGAELTTVITHTMERWDGKEAARRIELHVGRDLQFIRINGTIVGGLVGVLIHTVSLVVH